MNPKRVKPGDTIKATTPLTPTYKGQEFEVIESCSPGVDDLVVCAWVNGPCGSMCFVAGEYEVIGRGAQMSDQYAKPGDIVQHKGYEQTHTVIKKPKSMEWSDSDNEPGCAWFKGGSGGYFFLRPKHYTIVRRANSTQEEKHETIDVDESLKRQRDAGLRKIFG